MYLPADAQDRLFENITTLSAPGSRLAVEVMNLHNQARRDDMLERFARIADQLGIPQSTDMRDLTYDDPDRADVVEWLNTPTCGAPARCLPATCGCSWAATRRCRSRRTRPSRRLSPPPANAGRPNL